MQKQLCIAATELEELKRQQQQQLEVKGRTREGAQACNPAVEPTLHVDGAPAVTEVNLALKTESWHAGMHDHATAS